MPIDTKRSRAVFQRLERDLMKLSSKASAKSVHRFRTGTRRVQILLAELSPKLDRSEKKLLKLLNGIRKRAGKLRDLDIQLTALRSLKVPHDPRHKTQLVKRLIEVRGQQEKKLRKASDGQTIREICKRLKRAARRFRPESARDPLAAAKSMLDRFYTAAGPLNEESLHRFRILSKRARYAAEFAPPASASAFITELKKVQDALGDWHDWLTLTETASEELGNANKSALVSELRNVTRTKFQRAVAVLSQMRSRQTPHPRPAAQGPARAPEMTAQQNLPAA